ncbi:DUF6037 family protein [Dietzia timorensis]|nr:DUF6037 family protein [Dietzia timorensis]
MRNLKALRDDMRIREWVITCFPFNYNQRQYFVFVRRYIPDGSGPEWALVELCFADRTDLNRMLEVPANSRRLLPDNFAAFRNYFRVNWVENLGDFLTQFAENLGTHIPDHVGRLAAAEREAVCGRLLVSDSEDPNRLYCTGIMRNRTGATRTVYNAQKTQMLRPALFAKWEDDPTVSFCYSTEREDCRTDDEIIDAADGR